MRAVFADITLAPGGYAGDETWLTTLRLAYEPAVQIVPKFRADYATPIARGAVVTTVSVLLRPPPAADMDAAVSELLLFWASLPQSGALTITNGAQSVTYAAAVKGSFNSAPRVGISNEFPLQFICGAPSEAVTLSPLAQMDIRNKINLNAAPFALTGLTGGTAGKLDALTTTDVALSFKGELFFELSSGLWISKTFQLVTRATAAAVTGGSGAENTNPATGSLIIDPDDYHADTNDKVWLEVL
jgi:hypothetical protein